MLFGNLDSILIKSVIIKDNAGAEIFQYGKVTDLYATINLCYLNQKIDVNFGTCSHRMTIFFDHDNYVKHLQQINDNISSCEQGECFILSPFSTSKFGGFIRTDRLSSKISLKYRAYSPNYLFFSYLLYFLLVILLWFLSYNTIRHLVQFRLIKPIVEIISNLKNGKMVTRGDNSYVDELAYLLSVIHEYQKYQSNIQLSKLAAEVAHDIASPINAMSIVIANLQNANISSEYTNILNNSIKNIKNIKNITQNLLLSYRSIGTTTLPINPIVEGACSIFRYVVLVNLIETVIANKEVEWEKNPCQIIFNMNLPKNKVYWSYLSIAKLSTVLSNLLNNAYDSLNRSERVIVISLSHQEGLKNFLLTIRDTGCGIAQDNIKEVLLGTSFKKDGHGIGLSGAKHFFESVDGTLSLESKLEQGTSVIVTLPIANDPEWWESDISYNMNSTIVVLEDDIFTLMLWQNKLIKLNINCQYFSTIDEFKTWYDNNREISENIIFISDYQIGDRHYNGIDIIEWSGIGKSYLCTNYAEDASLQTLVVEKKIHLIPKSLILNIRFTHR